MKGNWGSTPPGRVVKERSGHCHCGQVVIVQTIVTSVQGSVPIDLFMCAACDGIRS